MGESVKAPVPSFSDKTQLLGHSAMAVGSQNVESYEETDLLNQGMWIHLIHVDSYGQMGSARSAPDGIQRNPIRCFINKGYMINLPYVPNRTICLSW